MKSTTAGAVISRLHRIFGVRGMPSEIYSDNGLPFTSVEIKNYMHARGIKHRFVTPYWPQANG